MELWIGLTLVLASKLMLLLFFKTDRKYVLLVGALLGIFCFSMLILLSKLLSNTGGITLALVLLLLIETMGYRLFLRASWLKSAGATLAASAVAVGAIALFFSVIK